MRNLKAEARVSKGPASSSTRAISAQQLTLQIPELHTRKEKELSSHNQRFAATRAEPWHQATVTSGQSSDLAARESCISAVGKVTRLTLSCTTAVSKIGLPRGHSPGSYHGTHIPPSEDPIRYVALDFVLGTGIVLCPCRAAMCGLHPPRFPLTCATLHSSERLGILPSLELPIPALLRLQPSSLTSILSHHPRSAVLF